MKKHKHPTTVQCLLTDLVEGHGISYWAEFRNVKKDAKGYVTSVEVRDAGLNGRRVSRKWFVIDEAAVRFAAMALLTGGVQVSREIAAQFVGGEEKWEYDMHGVDVVAQAICFGKIVYG